MTKTEIAQLGSVIKGIVVDEIAKASYVPNGAKEASVATRKASKGSGDWPERGVLNPSIKWEKNGAELVVRCDVATLGDVSTTKKSNVLCTTSGGRFQDLGVQDGRQYRVMIQLIATKV